MNADDYRDTVKTTTLINDLVNFRGDTWNNQRENVVLRGARGCLCVYLDGLLGDCIGGAARRGKIFALNIMVFCSWKVMSSGHKVYELLHGTRLVHSHPPCRYPSEESGVHGDHLGALESYGTLGEVGHAGYCAYLVGSRGSFRMAGQDCNYDLEALHRSFQLVRLTKSR
jgi:hypothetical protein